jgi:hypothetical protein
LTDLLRGSPKTLDWSAHAADAFLAAKAALIAPIPLSHLAPGATISLAVDASDSHVGGVLQQLENRAWRPLAFFSQKLTPTQARYSTFDRELFAAYSAVRHFRFLLEGRKFRLITDHKPLLSAMKRTTPPWSARQQRHLSFLSEFTSDLRHASGQTNVVADALSWPPPMSAAAVIKEPAIAALFRSELHASNLANKPVPPTISNKADPPGNQPAPLPPAAAGPPFDYVALAAAQRDCPDVHSMQASPSLRIVDRPVGGTKLLGDVSTGSFRPLLPAAFRSAAIRALQGTTTQGLELLHGW